MMFVCELKGKHYFMMNKLKTVNRDDILTPTNYKSEFVLKLVAAHNCIKLKVRLNELRSKVLLVNDFINAVTYSGSIILYAELVHNQ